MSFMKIHKGKSDRSVIAVDDFEERLIQLVFMKDAVFSLKL